MKKRTALDMKVTVFTVLCREHGIDKTVALSIMRDIRDMEREDRIRREKLRDSADAVCRGEEWAKCKCAMQ